ncbi:MAG: hypothetical protein CMP11_02425 [Zetaproteobacteria bacterium]|nr:hypothetical protein [Pseudobdellovibrionaceae bacterium]|tara:strand:+ start:753 stop:1844 length:1092 start_codon:yes stop_codon:yes gene_type:complete
MIKNNKSKFNFEKSILKWFEKNQQNYPWRSLWLTHKDPYHVWVSEIMLQQTTIKAVLPKYEKFIKRFPKLKNLAASSEDELKKYVSGLGYYRRFDNLLKTAKMIYSEYHQNWPKSYTSLMKLPGIGDYTASAVSSIAFQEAKAAIDGNVERVLARFLGLNLNLGSKELKKEVKTASQSFISEVNPGAYNQGLMELGQIICRPQNPLCKMCPLKKHCYAKLSSQQENFPLPKQNVRKSEDLDINLFIIKFNNKILLQKRPQKSKILANKMGFLTTYKEEGKRSCEELESKLIKFNKPKKIGNFNHSITHYKIRANVFLTSLSPHATINNSVLLKTKDVPNSLIASLDHKAWNILKEKSEQKTYK